MYLNNVINAILVITLSPDVFSRISLHLFIFFSFGLVPLAGRILRGFKNTTG